MNHANPKRPIVLSAMVSALLLMAPWMSGAELLPTSRTPVYWTVDHEIRRSVGVAFDASGLVPKGALGDWGVYQSRGAKASMLVNYFTGQKWQQRTFPVSFKKTVLLGRTDVAVTVDTANSILYAYPTGKFEALAFVPENSWLHSITPTPRKSQVVFAYEERGKSEIHLRTLDLESSATLRDVVVNSPTIFRASSINWGGNAHTVIVVERAVHWSKSYAIDTTTGEVIWEVADQWLTVKDGKVAPIVPRHDGK